MSILQRLPLPKRLSARLWLITLPSAVVSFERRSRLPRLPIGGARYLGLPLIALGAAIVIRASGRNGAPAALPGPLSRLGGSPATAGGIIALAGVGLLLRSLALCLYSLGIALAGNTDSITIEEPGPGMLLGGDDDSEPALTSPTAPQYAP